MIVIAIIFFCQCKIQLWSNKALFIYLCYNNYDSSTIRKVVGFPYNFRGTHIHEMIFA